MRRGYFVEGLSGAQFARPGCVDRLRGTRDQWDESGDPDEIAYLQAIDPANPWGSVLAWPDSGDTRPAARPRRVAGAWLLLHQGRPVLYLGPKGRQLTTFPTHLVDPDVRSAAFAALTRVPKLQRRGSLVIEKIDGRPVRDSTHYAEMLQCGFISDYRGLAAEGFA